MKKSTLAFSIGGLCLAAAAIYVINSASDHDKTESNTAVAVDTKLGVTLEAGAVVRAGIETRTLEAGSYDAGTRTIATALPIQELTDAAGSIATAKAQSQKAAAVLEASRREYQRVQALHADDHNVSDKALQAAEAVWRGDEANARAASVTLDATLGGTRRKWGDVLTTALVENGPLFRRLIDGKEVLLRVAVPSNVGLIAGPTTLKVSNDSQHWVSAKLLSASPQTDPHVQGSAYYYTVAADGIVPGMTLSADLPTGIAQTGALLPDTAVVWWQGKPWFYQSTADGRFERRELVGAKQVNQGWFSAIPNAPTVVRGAQALLSEEMRKQIKLSGDDE